MFFHLLVTSDSKNKQNKGMYNFEDNGMSCLISLKRWRTNCH